MKYRSSRWAPALLVATLAAGLGNAALASESADGGALLGRVTEPNAPLPAAKVYAYQLADLTLQKVVTDDAGKFLFDALPAGLYRVITFKPGFTPSVVMLTRSAAEARQFLEIELHREAQGDESNSDFWTLREQIPSDVLREIEMAERMAETDRMSTRLLLPEGTGPVALDAQMEAVAGFDDGIAQGEATQISGGSVGIHGKVRDLEILVDGDFLTLDTSGEVDPRVANGRTQRVSVELQTPTAAKVRVGTAHNQLVTERGGAPREISFEAYEVQWSQLYGDSSQSNFSAHYTEESNFYNSGLMTPVVLPDASRTLHLEGSYTTELNDRSTVQAGVRYRERQTYGLLSPAGGLLRDLPNERIEVFGQGGTQVKPAFLVEYGLYSTIHNGDVSFVPRGGFVLHLGPKWRASTSFSHRIDTENRSDEQPDFFPVFFRESSECEVGGQDFCYRASLSREWGDGESFVIGAVHREVAETQRLSFDEDFLNHEESLYLLPGDRLPELQMAWTRRLSPSVLTRVESTLASGGGGILYANSEPLENDFRYLVTSVDARFERSETGVFLVFHQLQQELTPMTEAPSVEPTEVELEKLELMLTQDIGLLRNLASQLALQLNMEVSRSLGSADLFDGEELRKRIMGGLAVKF